MGPQREMIRTISLDEAADTIHDILPDSAADWRRQVFVPDYIIERAKELGAYVEAEFLRDWEASDDDELLQALLGKDALADHRIVVITDLCFGVSPPEVPKVDGAFVLHGSQIRAFVEEYRSALAAQFVDGDVIIASPHDRRFLVFHHEGAVFRIRLS